MSRGDVFETVGATALQRLLDPAEQAERTPAKLVQPQAPGLVLADTEAAQGI